MQRPRYFLAHLLFGISVSVPAQQINITAVSNDTICNKGCMQVSYQATGTFGPGNLFFLQMSDINGSFANPVNLGYSSPAMSGGIVHCWFYGFPAGSGFRFRVNSSNPPVNGVDNGQDLTYFYVDLTVTSSPGQLLATTTTPGSTFQWLECSHFVLPGETDPIFTAGSVTNDYAVEIAQGGCIDTSACYQFSISTFVEESVRSTSSVHPNPTKGRINMDIDGSVTRMLVKNLLGETVLSLNAPSPGNVELDIPGFPGVYFLEIIKEKGEVIVLKVIKN